MGRQIRWNAAIQVTAVRSESRSPMNRNGSEYEHLERRDELPPLGEEFLAEGDSPEQQGDGAEVAQRSPDTVDILELGACSSCPRERWVLEQSLPADGRSSIALMKKAKPSSANPRSRATRHGRGVGRELPARRLSRAAAAITPQARNAPPMKAGNGGVDRHPDLHLGMRVSDPRNGEETERQPPHGHEGEE